MKTIPWEIQQVINQLDNWTSAAPLSGRQNDVELLDWRRRLARLSKEVRKRQRTNDLDWFWWLTEYATMVAATIHEDYQQFTPALMRAKQTANKRTIATIAAAKKRRMIGDRTRAKVLAGERPVSKRHQRRIKSGK